MVWPLARVTLGSSVQPPPIHFCSFAPPSSRPPRRAPPSRAAPPPRRPPRAARPSPPAALLTSSPPLPLPYLWQRALLPLPTAPWLCLRCRSGPQPRRRVPTTAWRRGLSSACGRGKLFRCRCGCCCCACCCCTDAPAVARCRTCCCRGCRCC